MAKSREARRAGVGFVTAHHRRPLYRGHRGGPGIRQEIDENRLGRHQKKVITSGFHEFLAFFPSGAADGLYALYAKWLDDGFDGHALQRFPTGTTTTPPDFSWEVPIHYSLTTSTSTRT